MQNGLHGASTVGRFGRFTDKASNSNIGLNTCSVHGQMLFTFGQHARPIGTPSLGTSFQVTEQSASWTAKVLATQTPCTSFTTHLSASLPGPMYTVSGTEWGFEFALGSSCERIRLLPSGEIIDASAVLNNLPQIFLYDYQDQPILIVSSVPIQRLEIITHEHWWFTFAEKGAKIMIVPLLSAEDIPDNESALALWSDLIACPPVQCSEQFTFQDYQLTIHSHFTDDHQNDVRLSPLPQINALLGSQGGLQTLPDATHLLHTVYGPYTVVSGAHCERTLRMDWIQGRYQATRAVNGTLNTLPTELAFAGDHTWDEQTPMDQLLSMRIWAQRAGFMPEEMWQEVKQRTPVPTAAALRASLMHYVEPVTGRRWQKDNALFGHRGEVSYDTDWYNGLSLSGLRRAGMCTDAELRNAARSLAAEIKSERKDMVAYYEIFCGWSIGAAWTDPRGELFNFDCGHNGLEGILAEAQMREWEQDIAGRDFMYYLAGRAAAVYLCGALWGNYLESINALMKPITNGETFGMNHFLEWRGGDTVDKNNYLPYVRSGDFPEFCALLKTYGPKEQLQRLADNLRNNRAEIYKDWLVTSVGAEHAAALRSGADTSSVSQGKRAQNGIFYFVSPDTDHRLFILDEDPDAVEAMYDAAMPLAPQLSCRAGLKLVIDSDEQ